MRNPSFAINCHSLLTSGLYLIFQTMWLDLLPQEYQNQLGNFLNDKLPSFSTDFWYQNPQEWTPGIYLTSSWGDCDGKRSLGTGCLPPPGVLPVTTPQHSLTCLQELKTSSGKTKALPGHTYKNLTVPPHSLKRPKCSGVHGSHQNNWAKSLYGRPHGTAYS